MKIVPKLLEAHGDPNIKDVWGRTVLDYLNPAATGDEATIESQLKAHGAVRSASKPKPRPGDSRGIQSM